MTHHIHEPVVYACISGNHGCINLDQETVVSIHDINANRHLFMGKAQFHLDGDHVHLCDVTDPEHSTHYVPSDYNCQDCAENLCSTCGATPDDPDCQVCPAAAQELTCSQRGITGRVTQCRHFHLPRPTARDPRGVFGTPCFEERFPNG